MSNMTEKVNCSNPEMVVRINYRCKTCNYFGQIEFKHGILQEGIDATSQCGGCHTNFTIPKSKIRKVISQLKVISRFENEN